MIRVTCTSLAVPLNKLRGVHAARELTSRLNTLIDQLLIMIAHSELPIDVDCIFPHVHKYARALGHTSYTQLASYKLSVMIRDDVVRTAYYIVYLEYIAGRRARPGDVDVVINLRRGRRQTATLQAETSTCLHCRRRRSVAAARFAS
jgi:hypothetical protein